MKPFSLFLFYCILPLMISAQKYVKPFELPQHLLGTWEGDAGDVLELSSEYIICKKQIWEYRLLEKSSDTLRLILLSSSLSQPTRKLALYSSSEDSLHILVNGNQPMVFQRNLPINSFMPVSKSPLPEWVLGLWEMGKNVQLEITSDSLHHTYDKLKLLLKDRHEKISKTLKKDKILWIVTEGNRRFDLYRLKIPLGGIMEVYDHATLKAYEKKNHYSSTNGMSWEEISPQELPLIILGNWNRGSMFHYDIQKEYFGTDGIAYSYKKVSKRGEQYKVLLQSPKGSVKSITFVRIEDNELVAKEGGRLLNVTRRPWTELFQLLPIPVLPEDYLGQYYHINESRKLAFEIHKEIIIWESEAYTFEKIILSPREYRITAKKDGFYHIFYVKKTTGGFIQVAPGGIGGFRTYSHEPLAPPLWKVVSITVLLLLISGILIWSIVHFRSKQKQKKEIAKRHLVELQLRAIRAQMNPHFLFNSLNSIQNLILKNENEAANHYLTKFSGLMRTVLNHSENSFIPLLEEIKIIQMYCELEALRFEFEYHINVDPELDIYNIEIPGMLIQPYVENAVIHGISQQEKPGKITISFTDRVSHLVCVIEDNGIGVNASLAAKEVEKIFRKSYGMRLSEERLKTMVDHFGQDIHVSIEDLEDMGQIESGTRVTIWLPIGF